MTNPLIKHYVLSLLLGAIAWAVSHLIPNLPSDVSAALGVVVTYFVHHYLENDGGSATDPAQPSNSTGNNSPPSTGADTPLPTATG
jgi:hypothetical protein